MIFQHQFFDKATGANDRVFNTAPAVRVKQIHGNKIIQTAEPLSEWIEADGVVTRTPNLPIGVITADCAPVLLQGDGVIGLAHAGWQGALNGVLENTIEAMECDPKTIQAHIGPCISQESYEVSVGFEVPFLQRNADAEKFFIDGASKKKLHFDLAGYCAYRLAQMGITNIHIDGRDTLTNPQFHSHRGGAGANQRNLSAVMLR